MPTRRPGRQGPGRVGRGLRRRDRGGQGQRRAGRPARRGGRRARRGGGDGTGAERRRARRREGRHRLEGPRGGAGPRAAPQGRGRRPARPGRARCPACSAAWPRCSPSTGHEAALAAALGGLADAVAVAGVDEAAEAMRPLKIADAGRAALLVGSPEAPGMHRPARLAAPRAAGRGPSGPRTWSAAPRSIRPAVHRALRDVVLVPDLTAATRLVAANAELRAVTPDGDVVGAYAAAGGSGKAPSYIEVQAAVDEARAKRAESEASIAELRARLAVAKAQLASLSQASGGRGREAGGGGAAQRRRPPARRAGRGGPVRQGGDRAVGRVARPRPRRRGTATWPP